MSYRSVPNVTSPFGIFIPALIPAPVNDSIRDASSSTSLPCTLSTILLMPLTTSSETVPVLLSGEITLPKKGPFPLLLVLVFFFW